tara:strand:+ start:106 stop:426 length:321 start_codon:yes stop_codon:yes gene_type:complete
MKLITAAIQKQLDKNRTTGNRENLPLKLFNATGGQTWLINHIEENGDIMYGLADLGFGCVEFGPISLNEMLEAKKTLGFRFLLERDMYYDGSAKVADHINETSLTV